MAGEPFGETRWSYSINQRLGEEPETDPSQNAIMVMSDGQELKAI